MIKFNTIYGKIRAFLITVATILLILFVVLIAYKYRQEKHIIDTSEKKYINDMNALFDMNSLQMSKSLFDYTYWDEFVTAIHKNDSSWYNENIEFSAEAYDFDYACVYDKNFKIVYEQFNSDSINSNIIPINAIHELNKTRFATYFLKQNDEIIEVCAASVHPTSDPQHNKTEPEGYLLVVREFDQRFLADMQKICASEIFIAESDSFEKAGRFTLETKKTLLDWSGKQVADIVFRRTLDLNSETTQIIIYTLLFFMALILLTFSLLARSWINRPLELVTDILKTDNQKSINLLKKSPAEFGRIGSLFEDHIKQKKDLQEAKERAEKSDKLKSAFLANMSHEIRTPMNSILGFSELLEDIEDDDARKQYLQIIQLNGRNLMQLLNDLMDLSKIEAGELVVKKRTFVLNDLFEELKEFFLNDLEKRKKKNIQLDFELPEGEIILYNDPFRIKQILTNLLTNAVSRPEIGLHIKV